jgi:hypothetical protein
MNGTQTVINPPNSNLFNSTSSTGAASNNIDTISTIIVPAKILDKVSSDLNGQGLGIDNQYPFKSPSSSSGAAPPPSLSGAAASSSPTTWVHLAKMVSAPECCPAGCSGTPELPVCHYWP